MPGVRAGGGVVEVEDFVRMIERLTEEIFIIEYHYGPRWRRVRPRPPDLVVVPLLPPATTLADLTLVL